MKLAESSLQFADLQGDFDEMQGEPFQFPAESHCAMRSWRGFSLKQRAGRSAGFAGKSSVLVDRLLETP
jgi:hypothetical protein